jgi:hypothetical protein
MYMQDQVMHGVLIFTDLLIIFEIKKTDKAVYRIYIAHI